MARAMLEFLKNVYVWSAILSWFAAQSVKLVLYFFKNGKWNFNLYKSTGGMPSAHTATVIGLTTVIGEKDSFSSAAFAIALVFSIIVITDALHLRREVGLHAQELQKITNKNFNSLSGHTPLEVLVGALIGIIVGLIL